MSTCHAAPWDDAHDWAHFRDALESVRRLEHDLTADTGITVKGLDELRWRHWIVAFCVRHACSFNPGSPVALVECGVGDGLTAYFACNEAEHLGAEYAMDCYDTWAEVTTDAGAGSYAALSLDRTRRNLDRFAGRVTYHRGLIPTSFGDTAPAAVSYLSIDLNAAAPTVAALEFFLPRLAPRAVVLLDDYGYRGFHQTKEAVDAFLLGKPGVLMKLPTGQAIWFA
jgi:hypothetical protein